MSRKNAPTEDDDPLDHEIDFSHSTPNPFTRDYGRNRNLRILSPDLLALFPDSDSVNEALRTLIRLTTNPPSENQRRAAQHRELRSGRADEVAADEYSSMKKNELPTPADEMLPEYDFRGGVRGKYARDYGRNRNLRVLDPDLLAAFPDSDSVNEALRTFLRVTAENRQRIDDSPPDDPRDREHEHGHRRGEK